MNRFIYALIFVIFYKSVTAAVASDTSNAKNATTTFANDVGDPIFLTSYIKSGQIEEGKQKALVQHDDIKNCKSYAGFITVNETYNSNTFFWFVLSQSNPSKDPVVLWMDGGPGSSTMAVLLNYHGPISITKNHSVKEREATLTQNHNVIYVDNPVGAGFSFTENEAGYATSQDDVGRDVLAFLIQFFQLFPEYRSNDFYAAGDSYGGKFSITMSRVIGNYNSLATEKMNLKGLILGNAFIDPPTQQVHADFLHHIGLVDWDEREQIAAIDEQLYQIREYSNLTENSLLSSRYYDEMFAKRDLIYKFTGFQYIHNYLYPEEPEDRNYFLGWIQSSAVRRAIHVGSRAFYRWSMAAHSRLIRDMNRSVAPVFAWALENYRVLVYNGQLDIDFPYSSTQKLYRSLEWSGAAEYRKTKKERWFVDGTLAGYRKTAGNFTEVLVRNAGHIAAYEQPAWICSLVGPFTHRK